MKKKNSPKKKPTRSSKRNTSNTGTRAKQTGRRLSDQMAYEDRERREREALKRRVGGGTKRKKKTTGLSKARKSQDAQQRGLHRRYGSIFGAGD